ncbi:hypothetical protein DFH09DRAFT_1075960 [Mycena vulgaris]|nr:hypothetical protein DFH09DRAFT_1075960 [Mycena vulgaris]
MRVGPSLKSPLQLPPRETACFYATSQNPRRNGMQVVSAPTQWCCVEELTDGRQEGHPSLMFFLQLLEKDVPKQPAGKKSAQKRFNDFKLKSDSLESARDSLAWTYWFLKYSETETGVQGQPNVHSATMLNLEFPGPPQPKW